MSLAWCFVCIIGIIELVMCCKVDKNVKYLIIECASLIISFISCIFISLWQEAKDASYILEKQREFDYALYIIGLISLVICQTTIVYLHTIAYIDKKEAIKQEQEKIRIRNIVIYEKQQRIKKAELDEKLSKSGTYKTLVNFFNTINEDLGDKIKDIGSNSSTRILFREDLLSLTDYKKYTLYKAIDTQSLDQWTFINDYIKRVKWYREQYKKYKELPLSEDEEVKQREKSMQSAINGLLLNNDITFEYSYTSPAGRNRYSDKHKISYEKYVEYTEKIITNTLAINSEQQLKKVERAKMNPSLRYDILKRDNFKCQICGRTQSDGVTLEVDHKIPIAKGGKTEPSNLWTLCFDCNRGKSDKMA